MSYDLQSLDSLEEFNDLISSLKTELEEVTRLRNNYSPINRRLPAEILCEIFLQLSKECHHRYHSLFPFSTPTPASRPNPYAWIVATHVCRHWRDTALTFPGLWTSIYNKKPNYIRAFIVRSQQAPLDIKEHYTDHIYMREVLHDLLRERHRWRTFECTVPVLEWTNFDDVPQLEELRLRDPFRTPFVPTSTPSPCVSPRLRRVKVYSMPYSFIESLVKRDSITNLSLAHITPNQSAATWRNVLGLLPALEELELSGVFQPSPYLPPHSFSSPRPIDFPMLRHLRLVEMDDSRAAPTFLEMITLPSPTRISFEGRVHELEDLRRLLEFVRRRLTGDTIGAEPPRDILACRVVSEKIPFQDPLLVEVWTDPISMQALSLREHAPKPDISLQWETYANVVDVRRTAQIVFDTLPLTKLRLLHFSGLMSHVLDRQQLDKFQSVRELCVDYTSSAYFLLPEGQEAEFMCPLATEETPIPFPNLEHLTLQSLQWHRHPPGRPGTCSDDVVYDVRGVLHRRKAAGLSLKSVNLRGGINMYEEEAMALVQEGLVETVEQCDTGVSSECPMCSQDVGEE